ncbi:MAG: hypothetical protein DRO73_05295 [Candidatus Thorarchaeota archaeon]|nr:MAG: hypothetical protein DRO73_05295 [Candidatus Thorarchaeota archaeon]
MVTYVPYLNIAVGYGALGDADLALRHAEKALQLARRAAGDQPAPYIEMARALVLNGRLDEAFDHLETGGRFAIKSDSLREQRRYYLVRGILARKSGNYDEAVRAFKRGLHLAGSLGNLYHILQILFNLAEAELAQAQEAGSEGAVVQSSLALSRIQQIAVEQDIPALLIQANLLRAELEKFRGNLRIARDHLTEALRLCDKYHATMLRARVTERIEALDTQEPRHTIIGRFRTFVRQMVVPSVRRRRIIFEIYGCIIMMRDTGLEVFADYLDPRLTSDPSLVAGLITAVSSFTRELKEDTSGSLQSIIHQDIAVLLEHGKFTTCALLVSKDTSEARMLQRVFLSRFEREYADRLQAYMSGMVNPIDARNLLAEVMNRRH